MKLLKAIFALIMLSLACSISYGQSYIPFATGRTTDTARTTGSLLVPFYVRLPIYGSSDSDKVLGVMPNGMLVLRTKGSGGADSAVFATRYWVTTNFAPISGSGNYIQNQYEYFQDADFKINGKARFGDSTTTPNIDNSTVAIGADSINASDLKFMQYINARWGYTTPGVATANLYGIYCRTAINQSNTAAWTALSNTHPQLNGILANVAVNPGAIGSVKYATGLRAGVGGLTGFNFERLAGCVLGGGGSTVSGVDTPVKYMMGLHIEDFNRGAYNTFIHIVNSDSAYPYNGQYGILERLRSSPLGYRNYLSSPLMLKYDGSPSNYSLVNAGTSLFSDTVAFNDKVRATHSVTNPSGSTAQYNNSLTVNAAAAPYTSSVFGVQQLLTVGTSNTQNWTNSNGSMAAFFTALTTGAASGTITKLVGGSFGVQQSGSGATVTTGVGVRSALTRTSGTFTNGISFNAVPATGAVGNVTYFLAGTETPQSGNYTFYDASSFVKYFGISKSMFGSTSTDDGDGRELEVTGQAQITDSLLVDGYGKITNADAGSLSTDSIVTRTSTGVLGKIAPFNTLSSASSWALLGNSTDAGTNFLGTTNNTSIRFRTNNTAVAVLDSNGNFGVGTATPSEKIHISGAVNGNVRLRVDNTTNGTSSLAGMYVSNGAKGFAVSYFPSGYTVVPAVADAGVLRVDGTVSGGLFIRTGGATSIKLGTNDVDRMTIADASITTSVAAGVGGAPPASAILSATSTSQGFLPPRMTGAQAEAISTPADGLLVYINNGNGATITSVGFWGVVSGTWTKLN